MAIKTRKKETTIKWKTKLRKLSLRNERMHIQSKLNKWLLIHIKLNGQSIRLAKQQKSKYGKKRSNIKKINTKRMYISTKDKYQS